MINSHKDLIVWQKSIDLTFLIYEVTESFPREEQYNLVSQMRRSAVSISSNIAEGRSRGTRKDFQQFLRVAYGSAAELETQLIIAQKLKKTRDLDYSKIVGLLTEVMKILNVMISKFNLKADS